MPTNSRGLDSPEAQLILACARVDMVESQRVRIRELLMQKIDWPRLREDATRQGVIALLRAHLKSEFSDLVPKEELDKINEIASELGHRNLALAGELLRSVQLLGTAGVSATPYKGAAAAVEIYGNLTLRPFSDIDLLIPRDDFSSAKRALVEAGFVPEFQMSDAEESDYLATNCEYNFDRPGGGVHVELHWAVVPPEYSISLRSEDLRVSDELIAIAGRETATLVSEDLLLALCAHGYKHYWGRLFWLCDVAELVKRKRLDWRLIAERSLSFGCERVVTTALLLAESLLDLELPEDAKNELCIDLAARKAARMPLAWILLNGDSRKTVIAKRRFLMAAREHRRDRLALRMRGVRWLFTPNEQDRAWLRLPRWLSIGYLALRPLRLVVQYAFRLPRFRR